MITLPQRCSEPSEPSELTVSGLGFCWLGVNVGVHYSGKSTKLLDLLLSEDGLDDMKHPSVGIEANV